jgi:hypothetical protein
MAEADANEGWLDNPETNAAFQSALTSLMQESDRGAVLIAAETVSNHLEASFRALAPKFFAPKIESVLGYPSALGSLSSRSDVAVLIGLLPENAYRAITLLRRVRNTAAHSDSAFKLDNEKQRIQAMLAQIGGNMSVALRTMGGEILLRNAFDNLKVEGQKMSETLGRNPFETDEQIAEVVRKHPDTENLSNERLPRMELGLAIWLLVGLMTLARDEFIARARENPIADGTSESSRTDSSSPHR